MQPTSGAQAVVAPQASDWIDWSHIETVLLDMDGTILDLNYDNYVWDELVPLAFAQLADLPVDLARQRILGQMRKMRGTISYYSFDYWSEFTGVDLTALHREAVSLIDYRPGALEFLRWLRASGIQCVIATNAHRHSVVIKEDHADICNEVDAIVSSHDYGIPKEQPGFWRALQSAHPYDGRRSVFIDDNEPVLDAAHKAGIRHLLGIVQPDSQRAARGQLTYPSFNDFREICPQIGVRAN